jgi:PTH1 family peptidyl-tRNA hydrolase
VAKVNVHLHVVIGLGNPGADFAETRHNVGFWLVQDLAAKLGLVFSRPLFQSLAIAYCPAKNLQALYPELSMPENAQVAFIQPLTFMNRSGDIWPGLVRSWQRKGYIVSQPLVAVDQMDLPPGDIRLKAKGGTAGHNGLKSLETVLDSAFYPLYIGIGRPEPSQSVIDHVLGKASNKDSILIHQAITRGSRALAVFVAQGIEKAIHVCNQKQSAD